MKYKEVTNEKGLILNIIHPREIDVEMIDPIHFLVEIAIIQLGKNI